MKMMLATSAMISMTLLSANAQLAEDPELEHECTSWMVFPDMAGGYRILHKNRDAKPRDIAISRWSDSSKHKWIGLGSAGSPNMGISEKGLAIVMNSGEATFENEPAEEGRMGTPSIARYLLENTTTAAEAVAEFQKIIDRRGYTHEKRGSIFFIMDLKEGYVIECTAHHALPVRVADGIHVRANIWKNPGMAKYTRNSCKATMNSASREFQATTNLNLAVDDHGKITIEDIANISRLLGDVEAIGNERGVCGKTTNSAATLLLDEEFPDVLSAEFVTIGPPRHTAYLPVPICIEDIPADILDETWSKASFARFDKDGLEFDCTVWKQLETDLRNDFMVASDKARQLLRDGKRDAAVEIMRNMFAAGCDKARPQVLGTEVKKD